MRDIITGNKVSYLTAAQECLATRDFSFVKVSPGNLGFAFKVTVTDSGTKIVLSDRGGKFAETTIFSGIGIIMMSDKDWADIPVAEADQPEFCQGANAVIFSDIAIRW